MSNPTLQQVREGVQGMATREGYTATVAAAGAGYLVTVERSDGRKAAKVFDPAVERALGPWVKELMHGLDVPA